MGLFTHQMDVCIARANGGREGEERTGEREIISTNHSRDVLSGIIKPFADWSARRLVKKSLVLILFKHSLTFLWLS